MFQHFVAVALGGALGASARFGVSLLVAQTQPERPWLATFVVNVVGAFAFGLIAGWLTSRGQWSELTQAFVLTGLLGAFTTFSTFAYDHLRLLDTNGAFAAGLYLVASITVGIGLFFVGYAMMIAIGSGSGA